MKKITLTLTFLCCIIFFSIAQPTYNSLINDPQVTNKEANYLLNRMRTEYYYDSLRLTLPAGSSMQGYKSFGRWDNFWHGRNSEPGVQPGGDIYVAQKYAEMLKNGSFSNCNTSPGNQQWSLVGPKSSPKSDMGVVFAVAVHPSNLNVIYAGTQASGLWKTTNKGKTWSCITDDLKFSSLGVSSILIDPNNSQHVFFASGAHGHGTKTSYGAGIFESTNGGQTWNRIFFDPPPNLPGFKDYFISKIVFKPGDINTLYALGMGRVYKLTFQGNGIWASTGTTQNFFAGLDNQDIGSMTNYLIDFEVYVKDGNTNIVVSSQARFSMKSTETPNIRAVVWHSSNDGLTWTQRPLPGSGIKPDLDCGIITLDISSSSPNTLYAWRIDYSNSYTANLYKTSDDGQTWTFMTSATATVAGLNGNHDIHVSNYDANIAFIGEDVLFKISGLQSTNPTKANITEYGPNHPTTHADIRDLVELSINGKHVLIIAHDGGVSISETQFSEHNNWGNSESWKNINGDGLNGTVGLAISQFSGFDYIPSSGYVFGGKQDNAHQLQLGVNIWEQRSGGDGNMVRISKAIENLAFGGVNQISVVEFFGNQFTGAIEPFYVDPLYIQFCPQKIDPTDETQLWYAQTNLYRYNSTDNSITPNVRTPIVSRVGSFGIDAQAGNVMYMAHYEPTYGNPHVNKFFKSTNRGVTWQDITSNFVINSENVFAWLSASDIIVNPHNSSKIYVSMNQYNDGSTSNPAKGKYRVIASTDGGTTWQDMSHGLPPFPVNRLIYQEGTDDVIYAGTDLGVYRWNRTLNTWECYNQGLPLVIITDLQIDYCRNKILCSTWGRGIWEAPLQNVTEVFEITESTTWGPNTFHSFATDVRIKTGTTLTINGKVSFDSDKKLIVEKGARLNVVGGLLYNVCGERWHGIIVEGDYTKDQLPIVNQGYLQLTNATIKNANNAVSTFAQQKVNSTWTANWNKTGGAIIKAYNTTFTDNGRHVELMRYARPRDMNDLTEFKDCMFEVSGSVDITQSGFNGYGTMVTAWGVKGVAFNGCTFRNTNGSVSADKPNIDRGTGILSYDAILLVNGIVDHNCITVKRGQFYDLSKGINSYFSPSFTRAGDYQKQNFAQTDRSVWVENGIGLTVHHNDFDVFVPPVYNNRASSDITLDVGRGTGIAGIYTMGTAAYHFEANIFRYTGGDNILGGNDYIGGAVLSNSKANGGGGKFRLNNFTTLVTGAQMQLDNFTTQLTCNNFNNYDYGLRFNPEREGDAPYFGECVPPNHPNLSDILKDFNNVFRNNQLYDGEHKVFAPVIPSNLKTYVIKYNEPSRPATGNSNIEFNDCQQQGSQPLVTLKDQTCTPTEQLLDICYGIAWPKGGLDKNAYLTKKAGKLGAIDAINSGVQGDALWQAQSNLRLFTVEADQARSDFIWGCNINSLYDSTLNYTDSIVWFLQSEQDIESIKMLVATHYYRQDYATAQQYLLTITPDMQTTDELVQFVRFYTLLLVANYQQRNIYSLNSEEWLVIQDIATTQTTAGSAAKGILAIVRGEFFKPYIERTGNNNGQGLMPTSLKPNSKTLVSQQFAIYPNPSDKSVTVVFNASINTENAKIKVLDIVGRTIIEKKITQATSKLDINTSNLAEGTYFVELISDNKIIANKELLIQHK